MNGSSLHPRWLGWLARVWPALEQGERLMCPRELEHPSRVGFVRPRITEAHGQVDNWIASMSDGSRIHIHEYEGGELVAHRDRTDPGRGPLAAVWHVATETSIGRATVKVGAIASSLLLARRLIA